MSRIHPSAYVDPKAELGVDIEVGAFSYIGPHVRVGDGCTLHPRVTLQGPAEFGPGNVFYPGCVLGAAPQDLKYKGGPTRLVVGAENIFREHVTIHRGTEADQRSGGVTRIGNHNLLMVGVHVAHDAELGNHIVIANIVQLAGHIKLEDCVVIGGASAMHHFVTVGRNAYIAGMTRITHDVPPFMKVLGYDQSVRGVNTEGLRRWRFPEQSIVRIRAAARLLYARRGERAPLRTSEALREIETNGLIDDDHVRYLVDFLKRKLEIGIFGRVREHYRTDSVQDLAGFYDHRKED
ncbi:MAG: acyl-ACP--UDP-N-acetylglucosamine O-acyltransferase [Phycisphaerae bacterium]|nr:acyl-ACP--UDP-N-acetylglucosamine O-acyltransferase [Phycisphaerae bacterium]